MALLKEELRDMAQQARSLARKVHKDDRPRQLIAAVATAFDRMADEEEAIDGEPRT